MAAFFTVFITVFLAELGDKTQLASMLFASDSEKSKLMVFAAASSALIASTALAVVLGAAADRYFSELPLKLLAGLGFAAIGVLMMIDHFRTI